MYPSTLLADPALRRMPARAPRFASTACAAAVRRRRTIRPKWALLAALLAVVAGGLGYLRTWPPLATVMSASMAPTIHTGDMVLLRKLDGAPRIGDVVVIPVPDEARSRLGYPPVVIHRIVRIAADGAVTTKGDAYEQPDAFTVPRSALTTKVVMTVPAAGRALAFLGSPLGLLWLVGGGVVMFGMPLFERYRDGQRRDRDERETLHATLQAVTGQLQLLRTEEAEEREPGSAPPHDGALVDQLRAMLAERDAAAAEERRVLAAATAQREAALAAQVQELRAVATTLTKCVEVAERRAATAEEQLRAHLEQLPAQIEQAVALALAAHVPAPPPPPPPTRSSRFVAASHWTAAPTAWAGVA